MKLIDWILKIFEWIGKRSSIFLFACAWASLGNAMYQLFMSAADARTYIDEIGLEYGFHPLFQIVLGFRLIAFILAISAFYLLRWVYSQRDQTT
jgi:hypothetical protein